MIDELKKLKELTETLTGNGYLRDQAEEWEYALDAIPDYVYVINTKFQIKFVNRLLAERLGKEKSELYNKLCFKVVDDDSVEEPIVSQSQVSEMTQPEVVNNVYLRNLKGWFTMTRSPIYTTSNKLIGFICVLQDVTEKRKALKDLIAREATLETIFNAAPIGVGLITRKERIVLSANKFFLDLIGYREDEIIGKTARSFYPSDEEFKRVGRIKHAEIDRVGTGSLETQFVTKEGKVLDIYLRTSYIATDPNKLVFTVTNITNRKKRERQLKLNEERLESALKLASMESSNQEDIIEFALEEAVRLTNSEVGYIHFVEQPEDDLSDVQLSLFMWSKKVHTQCTAEKAVHYPLTEAGCWADCIRTKKPVVHNDYQSLKPEQGKKGLPEGHLNLVRHMSVPVMEEGRVLAVAGVGNKNTDYNRSDIRQLNLFMRSMWDIVKRKQAENAARIHEERLAESEERYRLIVDNVLDAIWTIDTKLNFTFINPAIKNLMGYEPEEWIGHNIAEFATKKAFDYMAQKVGESLIDPNFNNVTFETEMLHKDGTNVPIEINAKALRGSKGNLIGFQGRTRVL